jgi:outer membrane protein TolC
VVKGKSKMFFRIRLTLIVLLLTLGTVSLSRADILTYQDAIKKTLDNSSRIRVKIEEINISDAAYQQNLAGLYPEISANGRLEKYENMDKRNGLGIKTVSSEIVGGDSNAWRSNVYLWGQYYLSHWYKKRFETAYYEKLRDMSVYECAAEVKKLIRDFTEVFSAVAERKIRIRYASDIMKLLQDVLSLKKHAFAGGQVSYEEVLKVDIEIAKTEKEISSLRKEFKEYLELLYIYMGKIHGDDVEVEEFVPDGNKRVSNFLEFLEETPEYKARMMELEALKFKEKAVSNNFWPDISLYGRYDYYNSDPDSPDRSVKDIRETSYSAGILINMPLFDGGVRKWERKKNFHELKKQEESIKLVMEERGRDIKTLNAGYTELSRSLKYYRKLAEQNEKMLSITQKAHGLGERSVIDIMETKIDALTVERDLKMIEHTLAFYEKRLMLETDYKYFISEHYGDWACKY